MRRDTDDTTAQTIGCWITLALIVPLILVRGWIISLFWVWFLTPVVAVRPITLGEAVGLSVFAALFIRQPIKKYATARERYEALIQWITDPFFSLAVGYVVHLLMQAKCIGAC